MVDGPKLSVNHATTLRWSFEEAVVRYRLAEIDAIGVWLPKLIEFGEDEALDWLSKNRMAVSTLSYAGGFTGAFGHDLDDVIEETRDWIGLAGRLQAAERNVVQCRPQSPIRRGPRYRRGAGQDGRSPLGRRHCRRWV